jgi:hypothetical protein
MLVWLARPRPPPASPPAAAISAVRASRSNRPRGYRVTPILCIRSHHSRACHCLASHYAASGSNPDGSQYTGNADVTVISDTTFSIVWKIEGQRYEGFGMRLNDSLAATYMINGEPGLVIYHVDGNGLTGAWAIRGHDGVGTEHLRPLN